MSHDRGINLERAPPASGAQRPQQGSPRTIALCRSQPVPCPRTYLSVMPTLACSALPPPSEARRHTSRARARQDRQADGRPGGQRASRCRLVGWDGHGSGACWEARDGRVLHQGIAMRVPVVTGPLRHIPRAPEARGPLRQNTSQGFVSITSGGDQGRFGQAGDVQP